MKGEWIDISVPLHSGMVHWPDNPPVQIERMLDMGRGDICNVSKLVMGAHTGTHMDAPLHFVASGAGIDSMPLAATIGPARVLAIEDRTSVKPAELEPYAIQPGERILLKTRNSARPWWTEAFQEDFIFISREAAQYLAQKQVQTVGIDYLSVGGFRVDGAETHHALLAAGIWIIEGLDLTQITPGAYDLICLPLKIAGCEGAPARALLRTIDAPASE